MFSENIDISPIEITDSVKGINQLDKAAEKLLSDKL